MSTCERSCLAWRPNAALRARSSRSASCAARNAVSGALASMTSERSPGRWTTTSGRTSSPVSLRPRHCSSKSQRRSMPDSSRMRRNCDSPHCPRTLEALSEPASDEVSRRSSSVVAVTRRRATSTELNCSTRSRSSVATWRSTRLRASRRGPRRAAVCASSLTVASRSTMRSRSTSRSACAAASCATSSVGVTAVRRRATHMARAPRARPATNVTKMAVVCTGETQASAADNPGTARFVGALRVRWRCQVGACHHRAVAASVLPWGDRGG